MCAPLLAIVYNQTHTRDCNKNDEQQAGRVPQTIKSPANWSPQTPPHIYIGISQTPRRIPISVKLIQSSESAAEIQHQTRSEPGQTTDTKGTLEWTIPPGIEIVSAYWWLIAVASGWVFYKQTGELNQINLRVKVGEEERLRRKIFKDVHRREFAIILQWWREKFSAPLKITGDWTRVIKLIYSDTNWTCIFWSVFHFIRISWSILQMHQSTNYYVFQRNDFAWWEWGFLSVSRPPSKP